MARPPLSGAHIVGPRFGRPYPTWGGGSGPLHSIVAANGPTDTLRNGPEGARGRIVVVGGAVVDAPAVVCLGRRGVDVEDAGIVGCAWCPPRGSRTATAIPAPISMPRSPSSFFVRRLPLRSGHISFFPDQPVLRWLCTSHAPRLDRRDCRSEEKEKLPELPVQRRSPAASPRARPKQPWQGSTRGRRQGFGDAAGAGPVPAASMECPFYLRLPSTTRSAGRL